MTKSPSKKLSLIALAAIALVLVVWVALFDVQLQPSIRAAALIGILRPTPSPSPQPSIEFLTRQVIPKEGFTVNIKWGDTGMKLVKAGGVDINKYQKNYADPAYKELLSYLTEDQQRGITITQDNAYFWVNTLWALGLTQKSDVLDKGVMGTQYRKDLGNFASTGGWTLGAKDAVKLYSSSEITPLTKEQQALVEKVSSGIYRPCCGNPTSFPDCNHGMAILGLIELMASQGFSEDEIYKAALAFNSYWFPQTYLDLAYYFQTKENTLWQNIDPKRALSAQFSSAQGYQAVKQQIENIPGAPQRGGSCGA
ncbi:MAG: hypothetical protein HYS83_01255 [Candidatus Blackburnbacteria bacterium]|nr:hypothetical protein [Candidatus Blackburnbacteria bacterium]